MVGDALVAYAKDNGGKLGDEIYYLEKWPQAIEKYVQFEEDPPYCAALEGYFGLGVGYALNPKFRDKPIDSSELADEPLLIETKDLMPANQWLELSRAGRRHLGGSKYNKYYVGKGAVTEDTPKNEKPLPKAGDGFSGGPGRMGM
jgi:hypothetical protein